MHLWNKKYVLLAVIVVMFSACNRYYYQPNAVNAPMLKEQNDLKLGLNGSFGNEEIDNHNNTSSNINFHAAYSPIKYVGLMTTFSNYKYDFREEDAAAGDVDAHATLFEGGVGGYYPLAENDRGLKLVADAYVGYGGGKLNSDVKMDFNRLFIQPGLNLTFPFFDVGLAARISGIKYQNFDANGMSATYIESKGLTNITNDRHFFFEPALTMRGGYKFIKGQLQIVKSAAFENIPWNADGTMVTMGVHFSLEEFWKK